MANRKESDAKYRAKPEVKRRRLERDRARRAEADPDYAAARARLTAARARREEVRADIDEGRVWDAEETRAQWEAFLGGIRAHLDTTAPLIAQRWPDVPPELLDWLREHLSATW